MLSATRDGSDEPFRVEDYANCKRIYLGSSNAMVPRGRHVYTISYTISYTTTRQLGFFPDHHELFWNVTGLGWGIVIIKHDIYGEFPTRYSDAVRAPPQGSGRRIQDVPGRGRWRSLESHSISGTDYRGFRKILALCHGSRRGNALGRKVFRRHHGGHSSRHFVDGVHPQFLFRWFVEWLHRSGFCLCVWQFPDIRHLFFCNCTGLRERRRKRGFGRRWGRWGRWRRRRLVTRTAFCLSRCNWLYPERIASRPHYLIFRFAVGTDSRSLYLFCQACCTYQTHSTLTFRATKDFLHIPPSVA
jgi:Predicted membrane protein (DUF2207) N-terminal domain